MTRRSMDRKSLLELAADAAKGWTPQGTQVMTETSCGSHPTEAEHQANGRELARRMMAIARGEQPE